MTVGIINTSKKAQEKTKAVTELPNCAVNLLTMMFNRMVKWGYYPQQWKESVITMIHKAGKAKFQPSSYGTISLLPCLSKIFERLRGREAIKQHLESYNAITMHQFGFREKHGSIEQVNLIIFEI